MKKGSIIVKPGQNVHANQLLGQLGHSGNSTMPHLHMQFMNSQDFKVAEGVPFVFRKYEVKRNGKWETIYGSVPTVKDTIKY
jgi:murein DD-endopeptidase MepM/ murein hydrolase activator NlpD